jgi:hypothetical protein
MLTHPACLDSQRNTFSMCIWAGLAVPCDWLDSAGMGDRSKKADGLSNMLPGVYILLYLNKFFFFLAGYFSATRYLFLFFFK